MAIKRRQNWLGQQRVDAPHLKSIESAVSNDFDELLSGLVTGEGKSYVVRGFKINMPGSIGSSANGLQMIVEDSAFLHGGSNESGTFYTIPTGTPTEILSSTTNDKVEGSFTPNTDNYVGIEFIREVDDITTDQVYFWNPTTNVELTKTVPLALILGYKITITTSNFSSNVLPIAIVQTDSSNNVISITDRRPLLFRLGTAGFDSPDPFYRYPWSDGREENFYTSTSSTSDPFAGGDKQIPDMKTFFDVLMSSFQALKGTPYWYSESSGGSVYRLRQDTANTIFTGKGGIVHGAFDFQGQVVGMVTDVIIKTSEFSASGPITLVGDGVKDIDTLISEWNVANPDNLVVLYSGDGTQVPIINIELTSKVGQLNWNSNIFINFIGGRLRYQINSNEESTDITLTDNQVAYVKLVRGVDIIPNLVFVNAGLVVSSVGSVNWTEDLQAGDFIKNAAGGDENYYEIASVDSLFEVTLTEPFQEISSGPNGYDAQYAFGVYETNPVPFTERHIQVMDRGSVPFEEDYFWLFYRQDDTGSVPKIYARVLGGGELQQGESVDINDNTSLNVLDYIGSASESDTDPNYDILATNVKIGTENYNTINGENLTDRSSKLTSMMADKAQDKTIILAGSWTICENTTNGLNQDITFSKEGGSPNLNVLMSSSANNGDVGLSGTLSLAANQAAYFSVNRNASFSIADLSGLTIVDIDSVPLGENIFILAARESGNKIYIWDGTEMGEGPNFSISAVSDILNSNAYDEQLVVVTGFAADSNEVTGPIAPNAILTLPNDSRDSGNAQGYVVGRGVLEIELNGQSLNQNIDWEEVGAVDTAQTTFRILIDLEVDDIITCRIDTTGGYVGVGTGGGGGEVNTASNVGAQNEVFKQKSGNDLEFRTLEAGTNISMTQNADTITISSSAGTASLNIVTKSTSDNILLSEDVILVDATTGSVILDLPAASTANGKRFDIKKIDSSVNNIIIDGNLSETIDDSLTLTITVQYESFTIISNGTAWYII